MAALSSYLSKPPLSRLHFQSQQMLPISLFFFSLLLLAFALIHRRRRRRNRAAPKPTRLAHELTRLEPDSETDRVLGDDSAELTRSDSPNWEELLRVASEGGSGPQEESGRVEGKRKKKRAKKKSSNSKDEEREGGFRVRAKEELVCLYPFTSSSSVTQRKIKQQYDELMKSHHSMGLSLAQVGQFANCLVEAKTELQHKADVIQRKFTITKALLFKADRSSFDRLRQQIYKLELEQKRLEEDAFVYNWLQQQLKLSPAYKKMLEIGARMELKAKSGELLENTDTEYTDISFEELLAQEKKDSFWHRNGKLRSCSG